jgi:hypothetical protein
MNFQEKMLESTADLRSRASAIAHVALTTARARAEIAAKRVHGLKSSFAVLTIAGREFNKVARRHATRFVKENSSIAANAGKDVTALARNTYATLTQRAAPTKARKPPATRKRTTRKAA